MLLRTTRGNIEALIHREESSSTQKAIVWVWGARGGFDGPAGGIYGVLAEELKPEVTSLRVNYRDPSVFHETVLDTLAGVSFLSATGHTNIVLVGHSLGGAVVIAAAPFNPLVKAVVATIEPDLRGIECRSGIAAPAAAGPRRGRYPSPTPVLAADLRLGTRAQGAGYFPGGRARPSRMRRRVARITGAVDRSETGHDRMKPERSACLDNRALSGAVTASWAPRLLLCRLRGWCHRPLPELRRNQSGARRPRHSCR